MSIRQKDTDRIARRRFCALVLTAIVAPGLTAAPGCALFKGKEKSADARAEEFDVELADDEDEDGDVFAAERREQKKTSDFFSDYGRNGKKSTVRPGDDFLLSSKAKEIYANTER